MADKGILLSNSRPRALRFLLHLLPQKLISISNMASADEFIGVLEGFDANSFVNEAERVRAMDALTLALSKVQEPWDIVWQHCWVNPATNACVKTLIDVGVFSKWVETGGGEKTCEELAELTGANVVLIRRLHVCSR